MVFHSSTALPAEARGAVRIAQQHADVNIIGTAEIIPNADVGGRIVLQPAELAKLIRNTRRLAQILKDPEAAVVIEKNGL